MADQGEGPGGAAPTPQYLDQTESRRKIPPAPLSKGLDDGASPYLEIWIRQWSIPDLQYDVCDNRDKVITCACKFFR